MKVPFLGFLLLLTSTLFSQQVEKDTSNPFFTYEKAFSPNKDGKKDNWQIEWKLEVEKFSIQIFNRWGQEVFTSSDRYFSWDGTNKKGKIQDMGVYIWLITIQANQRKSEWKGSITLVR
jgi:gliding motility-associated-like protein